MNDLLERYEKLHQQLINSENQRKMLADEVEKWKSQFDTLDKELERVEKQLEEQKEPVELGEALKWLIKNRYDFSSMNTMLAQEKYDMIINWYKREKEGK